MASVPSSSSCGLSDSCLQYQIWQTSFLFFFLEIHYVQRVSRAQVLVRRVIRAQYYVRSVIRAQYYVRSVIRAQHYVRSVSRAQYYT